MPFPWYHADVPVEYRSRPDRALQMYVHELKERAALLMRLGFSKEEATSRLKGNVGWDYELHGKPTHLGKVEDVVEAVYRVRGLGGGGTPSLDG